MKTERIRAVYSCTLETLGPVHVGNGKTLKKGIDWFVAGGKGVVLNLQKIMRGLQALGGEEVHQFAHALEAGRMQPWLEEKGFFRKKFIRYAFDLRSPWEPNVIREQMKDVFGHMMLPGSSLKGALRTACIKRFIEENRLTLKSDVEKMRGATPSRARFAGEHLCRSVLGKDPHHNLMRTLSVGDLFFPVTRVSAVRVDVSRLVKPRLSRRKRFSSFVECIPSGARTDGMVSIDTFLLQPDRAKKLDFMHTLNLPWIVDALNARTREMMINEQQYLRDKTGDSIKGLKSFYSNRLPSYMNNLKAHEAVLDVGWGIGWGGMTGQLLDNEDLEANHGALRSKLRLAPKYHGFPFPKSRRIAIDNQTSLPMGWVKIDFKERDVMKPSRIDLRQEGIATDM